MIIGDFGLSVKMKGINPEKLDNKGTPYYLPPEFWNREPLDTKVDVWAIGVMLYETLTGHTPFFGETHAEI